MFNMTPSQIAEILVIVGVVLLMLYIFYRLGLFKKD